LPRKRTPPQRGRPRRAAAPDAVSTEQRLLDVALTLFAERSYAATSTREIIEAAGVSKPVLYHYYDSKESLFCRLVGDIYTASERAWDEVLSRETTAADRLRGMIRVSFAGSARDLRIPRLMFQTHYGPTIAELREFIEIHTARRFAQIHRVMTDGVASGELRGGDASSLALVFCCLMDQHINILSRFPNAATLLTQERADSLVATFLHGCGTSRRQTFELPPF